MMKNRKMAIAFACIALVFSSSSVFAQKFKRGETLYTQTVLHWEKQQISAANFLVGEFLPQGTGVKVVACDRNRLEFTLLSTGETYYYKFQKQAGEPLKDHLKKIFAVSWDPATVTSMSAIDQKGIAEGKALAGMTRKGVIIALGYPPHLSNPSLTEGNWVYWVNRYNRLKVIFDENGIVLEVIN